MFTSLKEDVLFTNISVAGNHVSWAKQKYWNVTSNLAKHANNHQILGSFISSLIFPFQFPHGRHYSLFLSQHCLLVGLFHFMLNILFISNILKSCTGFLSEIHISQLDYSKHIRDRVSQSQWFPRFSYNTISIYLLSVVISNSFTLWEASFLKLLKLKTCSMPSAIVSNFLCCNILCSKNPVEKWTHAGIVAWELTPRQGRAHKDSGLWAM